MLNEKGIGMASYNRVVIMGNLTRDPDYKQLNSGQAVCRLGLASNRQFKNKQAGTMVQEVCYIDIDVWGAQAESCKQYLQKGRPVLVEGRLKFDTWEDAEGKTRSKHSIVADRVVFLASNSQAEESMDEQGVAPVATPTNDTRVAAARLDTEVQMDPGIADQLNKAKARTKAKQQSAPSPAAPLMESAKKEGALFTDEPPFQDDLPF